MEIQTIDRTLWGHINGYLSTQFIVAGCELQIFDKLESDGPLSASEVATELELDLIATESLLNALAGIDVLNKHYKGGNKQNEATFSNTSQASDHLTTAAPLSVKACVLSVKEFNYQLAGNMSFLVKEGKPQVKRTFGFPAPLYDMIAMGDPKLTIPFMAGIHGLANISQREGALKSFDLSGYRTVCDLGGGTGAVAFALAARYPNMEITVFDLPPVVACVDCFKPIDPKSANVTFQGGDFFKDDLPEAELYLLSNIIHNWSEDRIGEILRRVRNCVLPGGAILIVESLYDDDKRGPVNTHVLNFMMMLAFEGGRQRSGSEMRELLERHGFIDVEIQKSGGLADSVFAVKATRPAITNGFSETETN
ncbi:acetylserotonin O-methyltransferase-like [Ptychodera flava]|uniref:acetylserotonin O-methyltransferase-like n=1 Tax=Ptychodera flava TaxID=63121 RepID=UPI003969CC8D